MKTMSWRTKEGDRFRETERECQMNRAIKSYARKLKNHVKRKIKEPQRVEETKHTFRLLIETNETFYKRAKQQQTQQQQQRQQLWPHASPAALSNCIKIQIKTRRKVPNNTKKQQQQEHQTSKRNKLQYQLHPPTLAPTNSDSVPTPHHHHQLHLHFDLVLGFKISGFGFSFSFVVSVCLSWHLLAPKALRFNAYLAKVKTDLLCPL